MILHEPAVALTDLGLALEAAIFIFLLPRAGTHRPLAQAFQLFFAALALAALLGFCVHGFLPDKNSFGNRLAWSATLLAIGGIAYAATRIGVRLCGLTRTAPVIRRAALLALIVYGGLVLFGLRNFFLAVMIYLPAILFLLTAFVLRWRRQRETAAAQGIMGVLLSLFATAVQQSGIDLDPEYLNHNTLYHLIQALALWFLFRAGKKLLATRQHQPNSFN